MIKNEHKRKEGLSVEGFRTGFGTIKPFIQGYENIFTCLLKFIVRKQLSKGIRKENYLEKRGIKKW